MGSEGKCVGAWYCHIYHALLILPTLCFHKVFKLIFTKLSSWPKTMYVEHWRKLTGATFLGNFPILLVQHFCRTFMISCSLEYATVFPIKSKFQLVILASYFDLVPPFYFLKWNRFFQPLCQSSVSHVATSTTYYHGKCVLIYKLKDFR